MPCTGTSLTACNILLPSACSGSGGERVEGEGLPHLGRDLAPPGHREAQELCLPSGRTWRSAGCWRTWTEPSWCWTRLWMAGEEGCREEGLVRDAHSGRCLGELSGLDCTQHIVGSLANFSLPQYILGNPISPSTPEDGS